MISVILLIIATVILWKSASYGIEGITSTLSKSFAEFIGKNIIVTLTLATAAAIAFKMGFASIIIPLICGASIGSLVGVTGVLGIVGREGNFKVKRGWLILSSSIPLIVTLVNTGSLEIMLPLIVGASYIYAEHLEAKNENQSQYGKWQAWAVLLVALLGILVAANIFVEQTLAITQVNKLSANLGALFGGSLIAVALNLEGIKSAFDKNTSKVLEDAVTTAVMANTLVLGLIAGLIPTGFLVINVISSVTSFFVTVGIVALGDEDINKPFGFALTAILPMLLIAINETAKLIGELI